MTVEKERNPIWFTVIQLLWFAAGIVGICPAVMVTVFYDSPLSNSGFGIMDSAFILLLISFPIVAVASSIGIGFLKKRNKQLSLIVALLPLFPILLIFAVFTTVNLSKCGSLNCEGSQSLKRHEQGTQLADCTLPIFDGGDGLETTGCGKLELGVVVTAATASGSEAHNWEFAVQNSAPIHITVENDGRSCPQIIILDGSGKSIETFEDRPNVCVPDLTSTSLYQFTPPDNGSYIIRMSTPETPGAYWLKIE